MQPTVLLFDIDGTLITTGGAGRRAIERAFGDLYQRPDAVTFDLSGMTDRSIVRTALAGIGHAATEKDIDAVLDAYVSILRDEVARAATYHLHDGMGPALDATCDRRGYAVGLGTGNIRAGAAVKLARVGVYERFGFGGFGCDHENRTELIRIGATRGAEKLGAPLSACRVVVIGDTPKDVAAAHGIGAECIAVATGRFDVAALRASGAEHAFESLASPGALEALLG